MSTPYRGYDVLAKWESPSFDPATRAVLGQRMHVVPERRFFGEDEWMLMDAISARLMPQPGRGQPVPITPWIDARLADNRGDGFRHDAMPPLQEAWRNGLAGIEAEANKRHARSFSALPPELQDATLKAVQAGEVDEAAFGGVPVKLFFSAVLLKTVVGVYYAHPAAWSEIGFGGPASPRGYVRLGLDEHDPWEATEAPDG